MRRNHSFGPAEKSWLNRLYRRGVDRLLSRRYRLPDYLFDLYQSLQSQRLDRALALAQTRTVEIMTHPIAPAESEFLLSSTFSAALRALDLGSYRRL